MAKKQNIRLLLLVSIHIEAKNQADAKAYVRENFVHQLFKAPIKGPDGQELLIEVLA